MTRWIAVLFLAVGIVAHADAAENLKLNQHLDYTSDSQDGPLITGDQMEDGTVSGKPTYAIFYGEACFNSKRQGRRTVEFYEKYKGRVQFVCVDLDLHQSVAQQKLVKEFYKGSIPHVVVLNRDGRTAYNSAGEVDSAEISTVLEKALSH